MATIPKLKTLKRGDYIAWSKTYYLYYKVLGITKNGLYLSLPFPKGSKPKGRWFAHFYYKGAQCDHLSWIIIRANSPRTKDIEGPNIDY